MLSHWITERLNNSINRVSVALYDTWFITKALLLQDSGTCRITTCDNFMSSVVTEYPGCNSRNDPRIPQAVMFAVEFGNVDGKVIGNTL